MGYSLAVSRPNLKMCVDRNTSAVIPQNSQGSDLNGKSEGLLYNLNPMKSTQLPLLLLLPLILLLLTQVAQAQVNLATCRTFGKQKGEKAVCLQCKDNYHPYEGVCYVDILGCEQYVSGNICRKCTNGYILVNNECCDKACLNKVYLKLQNSLEHQQDPEEARKKAEMEGYEKAVSVLARNSIKVGQNYEIVGTKSQLFQNIYRYQVQVRIQGKLFSGLLDYNVETKQAELVDLAPADRPPHPQVTLNEDNIHNNAIYEQGYKYIYMKYGLELYELSFTRMTALAYDRSTQLKFVFVGGEKAVVVAIVVAGEETYTLWKEEKPEVEEVRQHVENLKQIEILSKEPAFQAVLSQAITSKAFAKDDVQVVNITLIAKEEYVFVIFVRTLRIRFVIRAAYSSKTQTVTIKRMEEVFHPKLQQMKEPERPQTRVLDKKEVSSSSEAKQAFDYLYNVRPSFRQTTVEAVKIETGTEIKTLTIMQIREGKEYRTVILKDQKSGEMQLVQESAVTPQAPRTTIVQRNPDGTTSITTNQLDITSTSTKTLITALKKTNIDVSVNTISTLQAVEGPRSIEYTVVLADSSGTPTKQVTVVQSKETQQTVVTDIVSLQERIRYIAPVVEVGVPLPPSQFYKPEIKDLVAVIQQNSEQSISISKIKSITVTNTTLASKYEITVEDSKGQDVAITALQDRNDQSVVVLDVSALQQTVSVERVQTTTTKTVSTFGVSTEYSNDKEALSTDQSIKIAVTAITTKLPELQEYEVVSSLTKTFSQTQLQTIILTNGKENVQVTGNFDIKTLRYVPLEHKPVPLTVTYPLIEQTTIPAIVYPTYIRDHRQVKDSESILVEKHKMFKGKLPTTATVETYSDVTKTTFTYEVGNKRFVAVVDYNMTSKAGKIVEMNPVQEGVTAVSVQTRQENGQTITSSNSVTEIKAVNEHTETVLTTITTKYPLLKKYTLTELTVRESALTDTFEVTYKDAITNIVSTITILSDKEGKSISVQNIQTREATTLEVTESTKTETLVIKKEEYSSTSVKELLTVVEQKSIPIGNITSITAELSPTYVTYHLQVVSKGKDVQVTVIDRDGVKEVVAVHNTSPVPVITQTTTLSVDTNGNQVTITNNLTAIKESKTIQTSIQTIISQANYLTNYDVKYVQTTDYGNLQEIAVTFDSPETDDKPVRTVTYYNKEEKTVKVISVEQIKTTTTPTEETVQAIPSPFVDIKYIPGIVVENVIKTDKTLNAVISNIRSTSTVLSSSKTVSVDVQTISEKAVKYTVILDVQGEKQQAVYIANPITVQVVPIAITKVPAETTAYYYTTSQTEQGTIITSNKIEQVVVTYPQVKDVLSFAEQSLILSDKSTISNVQLTVSSQSTTYTLEVTEESQTKTVVLSVDASSKLIKLVDFNIAPQIITYPTKIPSVSIDVASNQPLVDSVVSVIEESSISGIESVKEVQSITQINYNPDRYLFNVVNSASVNYLIALEKAVSGFTIISAVPEQTSSPQEMGTITIQTDSNGNSITESTQVTEISADSHVQVTIREVIKSEKSLHEYSVSSMKKIDYGTVEEIQLVFVSDKPENEPVHSVAYYKKEDRSVKVVSVQEIKKTVIISQQETTAKTVETAPMPQVQVKFIPGFIVQNVIDSDKSLKAVITNIQSISTVLSTATTVSAEVQSISEQAVKYTIVLDVKGEKQQAVYIVNPVTVEVTPMAITKIPTVVHPVYVKHETTVQGSKVVTTNNISYIKSVQTDFRDVATFITSTTGTDLSGDNVHVQVSTLNALNTYKITTRNNSVTTTVVVTSDTTTNTQFLVNYEEKINAPVVVQSGFKEEAVSTADKASYLTWVKTISNPLIAKPINVVGVQTLRTSLATQVILEVEVVDAPNVFIKTIKTAESEKPQVVSITPTPTIQVQKEETTTSVTSSTTSTQLETLSVQTTIQKTDIVGNTVTESTHPLFITNSPIITSAISTLTTTHTQYSSYSVKYIKTVDLGKTTQVVLTLEGPSPTDLPVQLVAFYDQTASTTSIVNVQEIKEVAITSAPYPLPNIAVTTIPTSLLPDSIKKDTGLKTVITQITKASQWQGATVSSVQVQTYDQKTVQYNVVMDVKGQKHQIVQLYDIPTSKIIPIVVNQLPTEIRTILHTQTTIDHQEVIISNRVESVKEEYPQTTTTIDAFLQENPTINIGKIDSIVVSPSSEGSTVSILAKNQQETSYVFTKYVTSESSEALKVDVQTVPVISIIKPKPVIALPISTDEILTNKEVTAQLIKIINTDTTKTTLDVSKITSIVRSDKTSLDIYTIRTVDTNNQPISIEIVQNPITKVVRVPDVSKVDITQKTMTQTTVQEFTGKSEILTTNVATIKESKEFKKITDYIVKNHPSEAPLISTPVIENTEKYQRATIKTISFSQEEKTIQGTYLIDQRSNTTVELSYTVTPRRLIAPTALPISPPIITLNTPEAITKTISENTAIINTLTVIKKVDFSLAELKPTFIEIRNYTNAATITLVFQTPTSNSRILSFYNAITQEAKVVDYTKVAKLVEPSSTVETVNELGQTTVFTTTKAITNTEQFTTVYAAAVKSVPALTGQAIKGVSTTTNQNGKEYTIITLDSGLITQVVLRTDTTTNEVSFLSHSQTSVAAEVIASVPRTIPTKLTVDKLQGNMVEDIGTQLSKDASLGLEGMTVVSGSVTKTDFTETYELVVKTSSEAQKTVNVVKDIKTNQIVVNNVGVVPRRPIVQLKTITSQNTFGQIEVLTNNITEIVTTEQIQTVIKTIRIRRPQFVSARPVAAKTVSYGNIVESTLVFSDITQTTLRPVQITSILNTRTNTVEIIDSRSISVPEPTLVAVRNPIKTIPAPAIRLAARRNTEITQIITSVQKLTTKTTQIQTLTVQDFGNVVKYVAIAPTADGKQEIVYFFDKNTESLKQVSSRPVTIVQNPLVYTESVNQQGETVISSTSITKITEAVPLVSKAVQLLASTFSPAFTNTITSVQTTGTTVQQIQFTTVDERQTQSIVTVLADTVANTVRIINVRPPTPVHVTERPRIQEDGGEQSGEKGVRSIPVTPIDRKTIQTTIQTSSQVGKSTFQKLTVTSVTAEQSAFLTTYTANMEDKSSGVSANVTLVQRPGEQVQVVTVHTNISETTTRQEETTTQTTTSSVTGEVKVVTNDRRAIEKDRAITLITSHIIKTHPELTVYHPVATQTIVYKDIQETTIVMQAEGETAVQTTVIYNPTSNNVQVVQVQKLQEETTQQIISYPVQSIPASAIKIAAKKNTEITKIISTVQTITTQTTQVDTLTVEDLGTVKKYVAIAPVEGGKQQVVFLYDKAAQELKQISSQIITTSTTALQVQQTTTSWGQTVLTTNSLEYATEKYPDTPSVTQAVDTYFQTEVSPHTESVQVVELNKETTYKLVVSVDARKQEVTIIKQDDKFVVQNVISLPEQPAAPATPLNNATLQHQQESVETGSPVAVQIDKIIKDSSNLQLATSQVVSITASETLLSTKYTVQARESTGKTTVLQFLQQPGEPVTLTSINSPQTATETVQESITTKTVNVLTSQTVTTTTDSTVLESAEHQIYVGEVVKALPQLQSAEPILIQTTSYGKFEEKTIILRDEKTTTQVTTLKNTETKELKVIDHRPLVADHSLPLIRPVISIHVIPAPLIATTAVQVPQITTIISQVSTITKKEVTFESITVEDLGNVKKYIAVQAVPTGKQQYIYLQDQSSQKLTLLDSYTVTSKVQALIYEQSINEFGEKTVTTTSVTQATTAIPDLTEAIQFITTKYPSTTRDSIAYIHAVEYPSFYESRVTIESDSETKVTIVVKVDKSSKEVTQIATYSPSDVHVADTPIKTSPDSVPLPSNNDVVDKVVDFIESSKDVPVSEIKTVVSASSSTTIFGTEVITLQSIASDSSHLQVVVNYNPSTKEIKLNDYHILQAAQVKQDSVTEFRVDALTGTKTTITNDTTVIKSSEITTALVKELQQTKSVLATAEIISTTTVEYPDKVKVVTVFQSGEAPQTGQSGETPGESGEIVPTPTTQVTSIYDKLTSSVRIIDTTTTTSDTSAQTRQVFTSSQVQTAASSIPSVAATTALIVKELPIYADQAATAVIVESSTHSDLVSYIYQTATSKTQVVVLHDKTTKESTLIESNPVQLDIKPFFYEEKKNAQGQTVVLSNNLTEVVTRLPKTEVLQTYIQSETTIDATDIRTVESTIGETFNTYTLVVDTPAGLQQYGYLVNTATEEVKVIENKTLPGITNILLPEPRPKIQISPTSETALPIINSIISASTSTLTSAHSVVSVSKTELSNVNTFQIEFVNTNNQLTKIVVNQAPDSKPVVVDQRPIPPKFVELPPVVIAETIDPVTKTSQVTYTSSENFKIDVRSEQVLAYIEKNVPQVKGYTLQSARKSVVGQIQQYDLLFKSNERAPLQISVANDNNSKNMLLLETKRITEPEQRSPLDSSAAVPQTVEVTDIEKENIKVLSKLGLVKDVKEYKEVSLTVLSQNDQFVSATQAVKQSYSVLLKQSVIIKVLQKKSLQADCLKVFFKSKDQIYQASIEINPITGETKLTEFIKIGTQATTRSEVNVYADLCYGYQIVEDIAGDSNIDFLLTYLRAKYEQLRDASLTEAQSIILGSGRINYKLYFKKDGQTVKYIVYYEPEYKRVLEVKGTSFLIGGNYQPVPAEQKVADPYFRKLDTYIRQNRDLLTSASVLHTESADNGRSISFRTVYSAAGKTYRSIAAISKDSQNIDETALNEIIEIPTDESPVDIGEDGQAQTVIKLDIHDLGKNLYFTEAHRFIQAKYQAELDKAQLLGASGKSNLFSYIFREFYMIDDKMLTVSAEYNPISQTATMVAEPQVVDVQQGYFPVKSDRRLTEVRNWLREKNLDLATAVMISSMSKPILFGSAYKLQFKDMTKYYTYVVYYDQTTHEMRILYEKDSSKGESSVQAASVTAIKEPKLKGFARPTASE